MLSYSMIFVIFFFRTLSYTHSLSHADLFQRTSIISFPLEQSSGCQFSDGSVRVVVVVVADAVPGVVLVYFFNYFKSFCLRPSSFAVQWGTITQHTKTTTTNILYLILKRQHE